METLHWKTLFSSTRPAEKPSTGFLHRSENKPKFKISQTLIEIQLNSHKTQSISKSKPRSIKGKRNGRRIEDKGETFELFL